MTNHDKPTNTNFWFGFALGSITLTAAAYMLGTKKGREKLKDLLEYADTIDDMPEELFALLPKIKELLRNNANPDNPQMNDISEKKESLPNQIGQSLESIIEKVKNTAEDHAESSRDKSSNKKYFVKSDT